MLLCNILIMDVKKIIVIVLLLATQSSFSQGFKGGLLTGVVVSQVDGDNFDGYHKFGFQLGAYTEFDLNEKWGLLVELKYIQKGSNKTDKKDPYNDFRISLNYIDLPVLLNYKYNEKLTFGTGLSYGYLMNAEVQDGAGIVDGDYLTYHKYDINAVLQIKYRLAEHIWIDLKGAYSVMYINDIYPRHSNNLISFGIGYQF